MRTINRVGLILAVMVAPYFTSYAGWRGFVITMVWAAGCVMFLLPDEVSR